MTDRIDQLEARARWFLENFDTHDLADLCAGHEAALTKLRAGEEDGYIENTEPTPGQWLWKYNRATPERRLQMAAAFMRQAAVVERCEMEDHAGAVEDNRHAWRIIGQIRALRDDWLLMTLEPGQVRRLLNGITRALDEPVPEAATQATDPAQLAAAIERVRGYAQHLSDNGDDRGSFILTLLDTDPMRTRATEAEHEAIRQLDADPHGLNAGMIVQPYRNDRGDNVWVFRCWGTDTCDGFLSLDHTSEQSAQRARDRHVAEEHSEARPEPATITGPTVAEAAAQDRRWWNGEKTGERP
jgi:hypothetical protein